MSEQGNTLSGQASSAIILYERDGKPAIEARLDGDTVWLTQAQMADLFQTTPQNITLHLKAIYAESELNEMATCKDYLQVRQEGKRLVSHKQAIEKAEAEYSKYRSQQDALPSKVETAYLETVKQVQRKLKGKP